MDTERTASILIGGRRAYAVLTTKATKEMPVATVGWQTSVTNSSRSENFEMAIGEIVLADNPSR
jgi:hypothetical protein